jgi:serine/threonine protein phosphatase 1
MRTASSTHKSTRLIDSLLPFVGSPRRGPGERRVPDGIRLYVVGDIHGRDDLLGEMACLVDLDLDRGSLDKAATIFLGDYVDRGPGAARVLERLVRCEWPTGFVALAGNHEDMLGAFLTDERILDSWRALGGLETIHSYGVDVSPAMEGKNFKAIQAAFAERFPQSHRRFLGELGSSTSIGDYFFCHAGVRPGVPLELQDRSDLLNIRDAFLSSDEEHGKVIVHGHTRSLEPEIRRNRIGIDTAAYLTHRLTCLVLESNQRRFLQTGRVRQWDAIDPSF